ncbi:beta-ketoacyl synthase chain length factor [Actinokineospora sp. NBRC 105648]|uniref:beta-ketoacyl synthase chain length factor n=1 Tax=Actinokineospora sp. NBRC 105648 TaxID=3032206 RepID=UPI0024A42F0B|nr:beta-ketoacyl synthase chain length factor [Actinokineospora sp. NBRC 105648]GLZ39785.1 hypothetical protein Acsp05_34090 [Actinokineospora sp. NBRC 105648]
MTALAPTDQSRPVPPVLPVLAVARWPESDVDTVEALPPIAGFVLSAFNPLVAELAERCLRAHYGQAPADPVRGARTAVVLASARGDVTTTRAVTEALAAGRRVPPLLFFQSNPNAVLGHVAARWGLAGPVVCTSPTGDPMADALACAALLFTAGEADEALVLTADLATGHGEPDQGAAVLVTAMGRP